MKRALALLVPLALTLTGCCTLQRKCDVTPGSPDAPTTPVQTTPQRPIVWDVHRNGRVVALAYEPADPAMTWTLVYAEGTLPFRSSDQLVMSDLATGVVRGKPELCHLLRDRIGLRTADVDPANFDLNNAANHADCD